MRAENRYEYIRNPDNEKTRRSGLFFYQNQSDILSVAIPAMVIIHDLRRLPALRLMALDCYFASRSYRADLPKRV
jgi:hypothetical protein